MSLLNTRNLKKSNENENKILVAGGSYFIGKSIVDTLLHSDYEVYTLNRGSRSAQSNVHNIVCDRNNQNEMSKVLKNYHFSAVVDVSGLNASQATILCQALNQTDMDKFIFISSSAVYDAENLTAPYKENDKLAENKYWLNYGTDKIEAEKVYSSFFSEKTQLVFLRPAYVYGENNYAQRESFIFEHLLTKRPILVPQSNPKLQFIYSADLANIVLKLINSKLPQLSILNIGNKTALSSREWVECCAEAIGKKAEIIIYNYKLDNRHIRDFFPVFRLR